jgi:hypothetical protein
VLSLSFGVKSVDDFFQILEYHVITVDFVAFGLGGFNLFRCDGAFWLGAGFVRYLT